MASIRLTVGYDESVIGISEPHRLVLAGCGGMGRRHLRGYGVLEAAEPGFLQLAAVVDPSLNRATFLAAEAEEILGDRPAAFASLEQALAATPEVAAVDIVAKVSAHHTLAQVAFDADASVLCEKPMAPTVAACRVMQRAAAEAGRTLSIAENYRRDPMSRLAAALLRAGAIGEVRSFIDLKASGGNSGVAGAWRYRRREGGPVLEAGVHRTDLHLYLCGPAARVLAAHRLHEPMRNFAGSKLKPFHDHYAADNPAMQELDVPDLLMSLIELDSGAVGQWTYDDGAHGPAAASFIIYGSEGQMRLGGVNLGDPPQVYRDSSAEPLADVELLRIVPDFALDRRTAALYGGDRLVRYDNAGHGLGSGADVKLQAIQVGELLDAVAGDGSPEAMSPVEVDAEVGLAAAALVLACHEAAHSGQPVAVADVLDGSVDAYQAPVNEALGL